MSKLLDLKQERNALVEELGKLAINRSPTAAESDRYEALCGKINNLSREILDAEAEAERSKDTRNRGPLQPGEFRTLGADERLADLYPQENRERPLDLGKAIVGIVTNRWAGAESEQRALMESSPTGGQTLLPTPLSALFLDLSRANVVCGQAGARFVPMETASLKYARLTGDVAFNWKGELATSPLTQQQFDAVQLYAKTVVATVQVSRELLDDAENAAQLLTDTMAAALGREIDRVILNGKTANGEPVGILNAAGTQAISMGANGGSIASYAQIIQALKDLASVNGDITTAASVMHPNVSAEFWGLTNSLGDALEAPSVVKNVKFLSTTGMPTNVTVGTANNTSPIILGAFDKVLVGVRNHMEIAVSNSGWDGSGETFTKYGVLVRIAARIDVALARPNQLVIVNGVI